MSLHTAFCFFSLILTKYLADLQKFVIIKINNYLFGLLFDPLPGPVHACPVDCVAAHPLACTELERRRKLRINRERVIKNNCTHHIFYVYKHILKLPDSAFFLRACFGSIGNMLVDSRIATCCTDDILMLYFVSSLDSCIFMFSVLFSIITS